MIDSEDIYKEINGIKDLTTWSDFVTHIKRRYKIDIDINPDTIPRTNPNSPLQAFFERQLAIGVEYGWPDIRLKAEWQNYWLNCCRSSKCDYIFTLLTEKNIDREKDIIDICKENNVIWQINDDKKLRNIHLELYFRYLLRRYAWFNACQLWGEMKDIFLLGNLLFPRLLAAIIIGFLPFLEQTIWSVALGMSPWTYILTSSILLILSFLYMWYECYRVTEGLRNLSFWRALFVSVIGFLFSFAFSSLGIYIMKDVYAIGFTVDCLRPVLLFASSALFIGIFIQVLWEEKTIAEPL